MAIKKDKVNLTYDALWFKIFMDSGEMTFYNREIFISPGMAGRLDIFMQLLGNVGGYARTTNFEKDINVVVFSDFLMDKYKNGEKDAGKSGSGEQPLRRRSSEKVRNRKEKDADARKACADHHAEPRHQDQDRPDWKSGS